MTFTTPTPQTRFTPGSARAALSYRGFRLIWLGLFASNTGTWMQNFILPAYVDERTESAALVGLLVFAQLGPLLLLSIPAGILADRLPRKPWLVGLQAAQMLLTLLLASLVAVDASLWTLFAVQLSIGVANALNAPAFQSSIPMLVARQDIAGAVSLNSVMINVTRVLGPALAAVLAGIGFSTSQLFVVNGATYLFLIGALLAVLIPDMRTQHPEQGWRRLLTGVNIARSRRVLARILVSMCLFSLICLPFIGLFAPVARLNFGIDVTSATYKWLYATWGLGASIGALAVATVLAGSSRPRIITRGFIGFAISLAAFALVRTATPAFPIAFVLGLFYFMTATAMVTSLQVNLRDGERASVMPLWFMAFGGTVPVGNLVFGPVMDVIGARPVMLLGAVFALFLAWWTDLGHLPASAFLDDDEPDRSADGAPLGHHRVVAEG